MDIGRKHNGKTAAGGIISEFFHFPEILSFPIGKHKGKTTAGGFLGNQSFPIGKTQRENRRRRISSNFYHFPEIWAFPIGKHKGETAAGA